MAMSLDNNLARKYIWKCLALITWAAAVCLNLAQGSAFQTTKEQVSRSTSEEGTSSSKVAIPPVSETQGNVFSNFTEVNKHE